MKGSCQWPVVSCRFVPTVSQKKGKDGHPHHRGAKKEQIPHFVRDDKRVERRSAAIEEQIPRASAAEGMTNR